MQQGRNVQIEQEDTTNSGVMRSEDEVESKK